MKKTLSGFSMGVRTQISFLIHVQKKGGEFQLVSCHYNKEPNTSHLHALMHGLADMEDIKVLYYEDTLRNDTLFKIRLTSKGIKRIENWNHNRNTRWLSCISIIVALFSLGISILVFLLK